MTKKDTKQLNVELPVDLIEKIEAFYVRHKRKKFRSQKEAVAMLIEVGIEICNEKLKDN